MTDIVSPLLQWLNAHPQLAGLVTFIISAGESVAIIGTIVPGSIMMTALGTLAGAGVIPLWETIFWAILGAIVGDGISYWIGHYFKEQLPNTWLFRHYPRLLITGEQFFHKYGSMSVFIGRFVGPVRALVPLVAGMLGMKPWQFIIANVTSAILWAPVYMLPGILLGAASLELPPEIAIHVILVLFLIGLFILLCLWFLYKLLQLISNQTTYLQNQIWNKLKKTPYLSFITIWLQYNNQAKTHGQLSLAFYCLLTGLMFLILVIYVQLVGPAHIFVNEVSFHLFRGIRNATIDNAVIFITFLGQKEVILPVVMMMFIWLIIARRWRVAVHALILGISAAGGVFICKHLIKEPRPWGIFQTLSPYSMPSGHATLSTAVFMGLTFLIAISFRPNRRWPIYVLGLIITFLVGISRLYLGAHWFTDVLGGWLLSATLLIAVIISYQRQVEKSVSPIGIVLVTLATLSLTWTFFYYAHFQQLKVSYAQIAWPTTEITQSAWWEKDSTIQRVSLFGFPSQRVNIEWAGDINEIRQSLLNAGWSRPPARDLVSTLHRLADVSSAEYLPLVSPQYFDEKPALILTKKIRGEKDLLVIRLWNGHHIIKESNSPLWVGVVGIVPRTYSWIYKKHPSDLDIQPNLVFTNPMVEKHLQWKIKIIIERYRKNQIIVHRILLIENHNQHRK